MKTPEFTPEQMEYLNSLLIGDAIEEIWRREYSDKNASKAQFRAGQRDGLRIAYQSIVTDQTQRSNVQSEPRGGQTL